MDGDLKNRPTYTVKAITTNISSPDRIIMNLIVCLKPLMNTAIIAETKIRDRNTSPYRPALRVSGKT